MTSSTIGSPTIPRLPPRLHTRRRVTAFRIFSRLPRTSSIGRSATVGFGGRDQPGEITPQFAPRSPARRRPRCQSIGRGSQRTHMTPAAMTASRGGGPMQVLVSRVHSDNRVQKGQTQLDGHPAVSTEVRPTARFGDRRRDGRCACKGARALCCLDRNRGGHHLQTDTLREWQACRHVPVPCVRLFPTSSTRSETKAAGVGNYAISVSGDTETSLAELSRSDKRRALAANRLIVQSSQNDPELPVDPPETRHSTALKRTCAGPRARPCPALHQPEGTQER